ncbi:MAG TPA: hypothetical protein VFA81_10715 [Burkholderiales bacterium]|nr:hypothetical protein [Burkholderiales bacterium]
MADYGAAIRGVGGAVSDLYGAEGAAATAGSYGTAATIAERNAKIVRGATEIKNIQTQRQIFQAIGAQKAQVGGAGFAESGSALDILRSSASQGAIMKAVNEENGFIQEQSYLEQANMFGGMQKAAQASSKGQEAAGVISIVGAIAALF